MRAACVASLAVAACAPAPRPAPPPVVADPAASIPLERVCGGALPLPEGAARTVGALVRLLRRINPATPIEVHDCKAGTAWPIAYATGESPPKAPIGFALLKMEGEGLLTLDEKNREAPTFNLCADLDIRLDDAHRVRAVALWPEANEGAFDPKRPEAATAPIAWLEVYSRTPPACALGEREPVEGPGEAWLAERVRCAELPLVVRERPAYCDAAKPGEGVAPPAAAPLPSAAEVDRAVAARHRYTGAGRSAAPDTLPFKMEGAERCLYEPPPAVRDVCVAVYTDASGARWYGRGDVTRTGEGGEKNYVDSYLTFQLLKRIEAERKAASRPKPAAPVVPANAPHE